MSAFILLSTQEQAFFTTSVRVRAQITTARRRRERKLACVAVYKNSTQSYKWVVFFAPRAKVSTSNPVTPPPPQPLLWPRLRRGSNNQNKNTPLHHHLGGLANRGPSRVRRLRAGALHREDVRGVVGVVDVLERHRVPGALLLPDLAPVERVRVAPDRLLWCIAKEGGGGGRRRGAYDKYS